MAITEVFPNPTVKQVFFEVKFPHLFFIESKIGDLQLKVMDEFPNSALGFERQLVLKQYKEQEGKNDSLPQTDEDSVRKIWQFISEKKYKFEVTSNSLVIFSKFHKTYNLDGGDKFRDIIKFIMDNFLEVIRIPVLNRIGLRYVDECPLPSKDNDTFKEYYSSVFPIDRFNIADVEEMLFRTVVKRGDFNLIYLETLQKKNDDYKLILDFDGFAKKIPSNNYIEVTDQLHKIISDEYQKTINQPVYEYMRQKKEKKNVQGK